MAAHSRTNPPLLLHPLLPTLNFHLSILGSRSSLQIFTITRIQNPKQTEKIQKCEAAIPTIWNKNNTIGSTLQLCTLQIFTNAQTQKID